MTLDKIEYKGYIIEVYSDDYAPNPREEYDCNLATFVCEHRNYNLGDKHDVEGEVNRLFDKYVMPYPRKIIDYFVKENKAVLKENEYYNTDPNVGGLSMYPYYFEWDGTGYQIGYDPTAEDGDDEAAAEMADELTIAEKLGLIEQTGEVLWLPISAYEHGGITMWLGSIRGRYDAMWDCGTLGFAYMERETVEKHLNVAYYGTWQKAAENCMEGEMKDYDAYIQGLCYGYSIYDENSDNISGGCSGFLGDDGYKEMIEEAKGDIDFFIKHKNEEVCTA